jgi:two-component system, sensor histidine kinase
MRSPSTLEPTLLARVRADQIATLFTQWPRTTAFMSLGAILLTVFMWKVGSARMFMLWLCAIACNQAWRFALVAGYRKAAPDADRRLYWGLLWAMGSTIAGALWGVAGVMLFAPGDPNHQALLIVCLFGVILGGINLTSMYKPSFYGFVLPALVPLAIRVALEGDQVHAFLAVVMSVVLVFILGFGHNLNDLMTQSIAARYENVDLIAKLQAQKIDADRARAGAEAANRGKTQFLASASHDLRQPLHALGLFAAALSAKVHEVEVRHLVASIHASVVALERLFSALMDISKLDSGMVVPMRTAFPLAPLFSRLQHAFGPLAAARRLRLRVVATEAWVESDPVLLERIVANLASNAVRYTERGGIVIGVRRRGRSLAIHVIDSGIGIQPQDRPLIFEEYYQSAHARRANGQGMGLGLAIIRRLAALLDHPIDVRSRPRCGSSFCVVVPRAATDPGHTLPRTDAIATNPLHGALVAVVDDEPAIVDGMRACFSQWGATLIGASSGDELLAALGQLERYPDLIVVDYRLDYGELGTDVVRRVRDELGTSTPALLISGDASNDAAAAMRTSGLEVLLKPVLASDLLLAAERLLAAKLDRLAAS